MFRPVLLLGFAWLLAGAGVAGQEPEPKGSARGDEPTATEVQRLTDRMIGLRLDGKYAEALTAAEAARQLTKKWPGRPLSLEITLATFAADLSELTGDFERAAKHRTAVLEMRTAVRGASDASTQRARREVQFAKDAARLDGPGQKRLRESLHRIEKAFIATTRGKAGESEELLRDAAGKDRELQELLAIRLGMTWEEVADLHSGRRNHTKAKEALAEAVAWYRKGHPDGDSLIAGALTNLGNFHRLLGEYEDAKLRHGEALTMIRKSAPEERILAAKVLNNLGNVLFDMGAEREAKKVIEEGLSTIQDRIPKDDPDRTIFLNNLGNVQTALGEFDAAKKTHQEALTIRRQKLGKNHPHVAISLIGLATVRRELREYDLALGEAEEAFRILSRTVPRGDLMLVHAQLVLGSVQCELRNFAAAKENLSSALTAARRVLPEGHLLIGEAANYLGSVQSDLGEYSEARRNYQEAVSIRRRRLPANHPRLAAGLNDLGELLTQSGRFQDAAAAIEEALDIRRKVLPADHRDVVHSMADLAIVRFYQKRYVEARETAEDVFAILRPARAANHPTAGGTLNILGIVLAVIGEYRQAIEKYDEALRIFRASLPPDHPRIAGCLINRGRSALCLGDRAKAEADLAAALPMTEQNLLRLATAQSENDQLAAAARYRLNLDLLLSVAADLAAVYPSVLRVKGAVTARQRLVRLARTLDDPKVMDLVSELGRINGALSGSAYEAEIEGGQSGKDLAASFSALVAKRTQLETELIRKSLGYQAFLSEAGVGPADIRTALARLPQKTVLVDVIDYEHTTPPAKGKTESAGERRLIAYVTRLDQAGVTAVPLGKSDDLINVVDRWRARYASRPAKNDGKADPGEQLRKDVWLKLEPKLGGAKIILVSPDGPLNFLPFPALPGRAKGQFLIHDHTFVTVPVPQLLPELLQQPVSRTKPSLLLVGGVEFGKAPDALRREDRALPGLPVFGPLPGTADEIAALEKLHEDLIGSERRLRLDKEGATKAAVVKALPSYRVAHLALHGFFAAPVTGPPSPGDRGALFTNRPRVNAEAWRGHPAVWSGLVFAGVNRPDRKVESTVLTGLEAGDLDLRRLDLVTLSACDTGFGLPVGSEGLLGLHRAFLLAGARAVIATQWKVPDNASQVLMSEFYKHLWSGEIVGKAEALRQAQQLMIKRWDVPSGTLRGTTEPKDDGGPLPPYFWAAFTLSGDWR